VFDTLAAGGDAFGGDTPRPDHATGRGDPTGDADAADAGVGPRR